VTRLLGIDVGARRMGLAVADTDTAVVRRLATLRRRDAAHDAQSLARICREQRVDELVVGLPLLGDGREGEQAAATRAWAQEVAPLVGLTICWRDERWTSKRAESAMGGAGRGPSGGPPSAVARNNYRATVDQEAAALILEAELEARSI
jgi:putative Holliday junction resolvase